jgi:carboxymethylenebutenolidase
LRRHAVIRAAVVVGANAKRRDVGSAPLGQFGRNSKASANAGIEAYESALKANGKRYTIYMYPGVNHAFNNDTNGARYDKAAADLAWERTLAFFKEYLGAPPRPQ